MIEKTHFAGKDGYLAMEGNQGVFCFYYPPSKKVVLFGVWQTKHGDMKLQYNKRKNCNVNFRPTLAHEVMWIIGKIGGMETKIDGLPIVNKKTADMSEVRQPISDTETGEGSSKGSIVDIKQKIKEIGGV